MEETETAPLQESAHNALQTLASNPGEDLRGIRGDRKRRGGESGLGELNEHADLTSVDKFLASVRREPDPRTGCIPDSDRLTLQGNGVGLDSDLALPQVTAAKQSDEQSFTLSCHSDRTTLVSHSQVSVVLYPPDDEKSHLNGQGGTYKGFCDRCCDVKPVVANVFWGDSSPNPAQSPELMNSTPTQHDSWDGSVHDAGNGLDGERVLAPQGEDEGILSLSLGTQANRGPDRHAQGYDTDLAVPATSALSKQVCESCFNLYKSTPSSSPQGPLKERANEPFEGCLDKRPPLSTKPSQLNIPERVERSSSCDWDETEINDKSKPKLPLKEVWFRLEDDILNTENASDVDHQLSILSKQPGWKHLTSRICGQKQLDSLCWEEKMEGSPSCERCLLFNRGDGRFKYSCFQRQGRDRCKQQVTTWRRSWSPFTALAPLCDEHATTPEDNDDIDDEVWKELESDLGSDPGSGPICVSCRSEEKQVSALSASLCPDCFQHSPMQSFMRHKSFPLASRLKDGSMANPPWVLLHAQLHPHKPLPTGVHRNVSGGVHSHWAHRARRNP